MIANVALNMTFALGHCIILNKIPMQISIEAKVPIAIMTLLQMFFFYLILRVNNSFKNTKVNNTIPSRIKPKGQANAKI